MADGSAPRRTIEPKLFVFFAVYLGGFIGLSLVTGRGVPWFAIAVSLIVQVGFLIWQHRRTTVG